MCTSKQLDNVVSPELIVVHPCEVLINGPKHLAQRTSSFCHRYGELHHLTEDGRGVALIQKLALTALQLHGFITGDKTSRAPHS